jgi:hypothetical protein
MQWMKSGMVSWEAAFPFAGLRGRGALREALRVGIVLGLLVAFGYCLVTAWGVLGELGHVKLVDCRNALTVVSVRDAILCVVGYRIGSELVRAVVRARRSE